MPCFERFQEKECDEQTRKECGKKIGQKVKSDKTERGKIGRDKLKINKSRKRGVRL